MSAGDRLRRHVRRFTTLKKICLKNKKTKTFHLEKVHLLLCESDQYILTAKGVALH